MRGLIAVVVAAGVLCGAALASAPLPAKTVDAALRKQSLIDVRTFSNARLVCISSGRSVTYGCTIWAPQPGSSTIVQGVPGKVFLSRSVQACGRLWSTSDPSKGCKTATAAATCWYQLTSGGSVRMLNVCQAGWVKLLARR